jgi:hypothetical protein
LLCYVGHHDEAYDWAERRKLETHPKTGAAQLVEIRETVKEIIVPVYVQTEIAAEPQKKFIFAGMSDDELLGYGVPAEWLSDIKKSTEDTLLALTDHLPAEAAEALLELARGGEPRVLQPAVAIANEPRLAERIDVYSLNAIGLRLYKTHVGQATIASREIVGELLR